MNALVVYLLGRRAGRLIRKDNGNLQFRYDDDYAGLPISQALPVQRAAHPHALCHAVFGGLLLEGDARAVLARNLGISAGNDYGLLQEVGGDCAGAVTLLPLDVELPLAPSRKGIDDEQLDVLLRRLPRHPLGVGSESGVRLSLAGAQPKLPIILEEDEMALPLNALAATTHIVKPELSRFSGLVDNEAFCMELARAVELPVATVSKHTSASGLPYLLVERYDRDLTTDPIRRLHQEDCCQALGCPSDRKYEPEGGPSVRDVMELLRRCSAVPARDLTVLWRALVLNWLIGNCDAHAKNFSLLYDARDPTLAPLYDLVSTTVYPELTTRLAMNIGSARSIDEVGGTAFGELAEQVGLSRRFVVTVTPDTLERILVEARRLAAQPAHDNEVVRRVLAEMSRRATV